MPGVGDYIAREVMAVSFRQDVPLLDRNMARVINRAIGARRSPRKLMGLAETLVPRGKGRDFGYAILDFAYLVCKLDNPDCPACPLRYTCAFGRKRVLRAQGYQLGT